MNYLDARIHWTTLEKGDKQKNDLRGNCTPYQKLACFVLFLKLSTSFCKIIYASYSKLSKELKNGIEILVGPAVIKLWIKKVKILFWSITQEPLGLLKFQCYFWVPLTIYYKMHISFSKKRKPFEKDMPTKSNRAVPCLLVQGARTR